MRRHIENMVNIGISDVGLQKLHKIVEILGPFVKSKEDVMFGYIIATIRSGMISYTDKFYNRMPNQDEQDEVWKMILERAVEIRTRISREFER